MQAQVVLTGHLGHATQLLIRKYGAAGPVMRVFDGHQFRRGYMHIAGANGLHQLIGGKSTQYPLNGPQLHLAVKGRPAGFVVHDMGANFADDLIAGLGVCLDGDLIRHGAGGNIQPRLLAQQLRHFILQFVDGGIFPEHIIAHRRLGHGLPHGGRWHSDCVATQVNHGAT